jgi:clan AA aspartic protease
VISGTVNASLEATVPLRVEGPGGERQTMRAVIDTGYDGALSLPLDVVLSLSLAAAAPRVVTLGDGSQRVCDYYAANVHWDGQIRRIRVLCVEGDPLLGTGLLRRCNLTADFESGGSVTITRLL